MRRKAAIDLERRLYTLNLLNKLLLSEEQKNGINLEHAQNQKENPVPVFSGFVENKYALECIKKRKLFVEDSMKQLSIIHGKYAHRLQFNIFSALINSNEKYRQKKHFLSEVLVALAQHSSIWNSLIDTTSYATPSFHSPVTLTSFLLCSTDKRIQNIRAHCYLSFRKAMQKN